MNDQIRSFLKRYERVVEENVILTHEIQKRDDAVKKFKQEKEDYIHHIKAELSYINKNLSELQSELKYLASKFKGITKKESFEKLKKRVDDLQYEHLLTKEELERKL